MVKNIGVGKLNKEQAHDPVNHPSHYTKHPSGVECIEVVEHMNFCRGNAIKYLWRAGDKGNELEDLKKARWYIDREIARIGGESSDKEDALIAAIAETRLVFGKNEVVNYLYAVLKKDAPNSLELIKGLVAKDGASY